MAIQLTDITNKVNDVERLRELNKTRAGRVLLKNITSSYLSRLIDFTAVQHGDLAIDKFSSNFLDLVRPNKFYVKFAMDNSEGFNFETMIDPFVKSITAPNIVTNKMVFKHAGKTVKIPYNQDVPDSLDLTLYRDIDNKSLLSIFYYMNFNVNGFHPQFVNNDYNASISLIYKVNMNYNASLSGNFVRSALNFFDIDILNGYKNTGKKEPIKPILTKNIDDKIIEIKFNNVFVSNFGGFTPDAERIDTFSETILSLDFNGVDFYIWDLTQLNDQNKATERNSLGSSIGL